MVAFALGSKSGGVVALTALLAAAPLSVDARPKVATAPTPASERAAAETPADAHRRQIANQRARRHNRQARALFNLGRFRDAAAEYRKAYAARSVPTFLLNLAQCHKQIATVRDLQKAIFYFESFLNNAGAQPQAAGIRLEVAALRKRVETMKSEADEAQPLYKRWWFWTAIGLAVGGAATGLAVGLRPQDEAPVSGTAEPGVFYLPFPN